MYRAQGTEEQRVTRGPHGRLPPNDWDVADLIPKSGYDGLFVPPKALESMTQSSEVHIPADHCTLAEAHRNCLIEFEDSFDDVIPTTESVTQELDWRSEMDVRPEGKNSIDQISDLDLVVLAADGLSAIHTVDSPVISTGTSSHDSPLSRIEPMSYAEAKSSNTPQHVNQESDLEATTETVVRSSQMAALKIHEEQDRLRCESILFGRSHSKDNGFDYDILYRTQKASRPWLRFDFKKRFEMRLNFARTSSDDPCTYDLYSFSVFLSDLIGNIVVGETDGLRTLTFRSSVPPRIRTLDHKRMRRGAQSLVDHSLEVGESAETEGQMWMRCSEILQEGLTKDASQCQIHLYRSDAFFEVGRCNTYRALVRPQDKYGSIFDTIIDKLRGLNFRCETASNPIITRRLPARIYSSLWQAYYVRSSGLPFEISYLLDAALSTDCIDVTQADKLLTFLNSIDSQKGIVEALSQIVLCGVPVVDPQTFMKDFLRRQQQKPKETERMPDYCVRLRKIIITSTSMKILPPAIEMSNRILRQYSAHIDYFVRVQFLDEIGHGRIEGGINSENVLKRVFRTLAEGIQAGGRRFEFLAFGNTQLREHGAFFFAACSGQPKCEVKDCKGLSARKIREAIGDVSGINIVAKQAARVGQAFSTTRTLPKRQNDATLVSIADYEGGLAGAFCFSDGVGMITSDLLQEVTQATGFSGRPPCAIQFRLGGAKGVLALVQPKDVTIPDHTKQRIESRQIFLRPSQIKFQSDHDSLEIVRVARYGSAFLNRQFITTLWSLGVDPETFVSMQKKAIEMLDLSMTDERAALKCLSTYVDEHGATAFLGELIAFGFLARGDPFVNQVLWLFRNWSLKMLKEKAKLNVEQGCFLMGVVDEIGCLKGHTESMYGQDESDVDLMDLPEIFVQIADPVNPLRLTVIEKVCIIGRSPNLHPGDMRMVRAVNKPELAYLHNVVVFPRSGDQDLASMCSGGDLDGDDYTIIWDRRLFPSQGHRYERCMSYIGPKPKVVPVITMKHVLDFMIDFMRNDSLGQVAHAHLAFAHDPKGTLHERRNRPDCRAFSDECMTLADLHSTAVDFPKTGVAAIMPKHLRRSTYPDFMEKTHKESFVSESPLSRMYRCVKSSVVPSEPKTRYDNTLCNVPDMLDWIDFARTQKMLYDRAMSRLMNQYGIKTEAEVVTGFIMHYNDKYSSKKDHQIRLEVAQKYTLLKESFRQTIHDAAAATAAAKDSHGGDGRGRHGSSVEERKDAIVAAMYDVTFSERLGTDDDDVKLSFPWICHDVLGQLSRGRQFRHDRSSLDDSFVSLFRRL